MAIRKEITITVKEDRAFTNEKMYIYRGDSGVDFYFNITSFRVNFSAGTRNGMMNGREEINLLSELTNAYADVLILSPNGEVIVIQDLPKCPVIDNKVKFTITKNFTDEMSDIGEYKLQIHLYDGDGFGSNPNRITIPPITFEVKDYFS